MSRKLDPEEIAFIKRINEVFLRYKEKRPFEDVVRDYRRIEEEFVERDDEYKATETKRRVSEWMLLHASFTDEPHEVCRSIWEELLQRGFSDHELKRNFTGIYAQCCQMNAEFDAGLAVLEPLITEMEQALEGTMLTPKERFWYETDLPTQRKIRDELKAGIQENHPLRRELVPEEIPFIKRLNEVFFRKEKRSFEDVLRDYRRIEEEFVEGEDEDKALETKRRITEWMLEHAYSADQPHEVCRSIWEELVQRGFSDHEHKRHFTDIYARCCRMNAEFDAGLVVLEPLITEIEQLLEGTMLTPDERFPYERDLQTHRGIRDKLKAGIRE